MQESGQGSKDEKKKALSTNIYHMFRGRYKFMDCAGETPARKEVTMINCEIQLQGFDHGQ